MRETPDDRALIQRLYQEKAHKLPFVAKRIVQDDLKAEEAEVTQGKGNDLDKAEEDKDPKETVKKLLARKEKSEVTLEELSA